MGTCIPAEDVTVVPAIMEDEWSGLVAQIERMRSVATDIHIDVMDGVLVPTRSFPYHETRLTGRELPQSESITYDVHLMVQGSQQIQDIGEQYIQAGCTTILAQVEGFFTTPGDSDTLDTPAVRQALRAWRTAGVSRVGLSILLDTPLDCITQFIAHDELEMVQIMSIARIGYQGEAFDDRALIRIRALRTRYPRVTIAIDGGMNKATIEDAVMAGATRIIVGSALSQSGNISAAYQHLQQTIQEISCDKT